MLRAKAVAILAAAAIGSLWWGLSHPVDVGLDEFRALGAAHRQLLKYRSGRPRSFVKTTWQDIAAGRLPVGVGVEIEGVISGIFGSPDGDYNFDIGNLHCEITLVSRLLRSVALPRYGERVRVRGWTFYDMGHDDEPVYDPAHPGRRQPRITLWEVHPVLEVERL